MLFFSRVDALKEELQRLEAMTHLSKEEKEFLVKEKQDVLFKSVSDLAASSQSLRIVSVQFITVLEAVSQITRASPETPREQIFQKDYSKQIDAVIEQLRQPITLTNPHACWLQFRQVRQHPLRTTRHCA